MAEELKVLTKTKRLYSYIINMVDKAPKRFRFSISAKLMDLGMNILEKVYLANDIFLSGANNHGLMQTRNAYQAEALAKLKILGYLTMVASENGCILVKQYEVISKLISDCQRLLVAWMKSDLKRFKGAGNNEVTEYK